MYWYAVLNGSAFIAVKYCTRFEMNKYMCTGVTVLYYVLNLISATKVKIKDY